MRLILVAAILVAGLVAFGGEAHYDFTWQFREVGDSTP